MLRVEVRDDGIGGVDPSGHGLVGMADRVSALGGQLRVESPKAAARSWPQTSPSTASFHIGVVDCCSFEARPAARRASRGVLGWTRSSCGAVTSIGCASSGSACSSDSPAGTTPLQRHYARATGHTGSACLALRRTATPLPVWDNAWSVVVRRHPSFRSALVAMQKVEGSIASAASREGPAAAGFSRLRGPSRRLRLPLRGPDLCPYCPIAAIASRARFSARVRGDSWSSR